jgi:mannosyltransferase OCH1-like enzyme
MIPNIVHFNYGLTEQKEDFSFVYYIAVLSCYVINKPDKIYFFYHYEPKGKWWEKTKMLVESIVVDIPTHIGSKELRHVAHKSDILRLKMLQKYGGIYLDIDTICVRSYKDLLYNKFVIGNEITDRGQNMGLCNAIMMAEPNSEFINIWLDNYENAFDTNKWQSASTFLPFEIAKKTNCITVLPRGAFLYPSWDRLELIFVEPYEIPNELFVLHLWNQHSQKKYLNNITNFDWIVDNSYTLYGRLLQNVVKEMSYMNETNIVKKVLENTTFNDFISQLNNVDYVKCNNLPKNFNNVKEHFLMCKDYGLILNSSFINDNKHYARNVCKVFKCNFDLYNPITIEPKELSYVINNYNNVVGISFINLPEKCHLKLLQNDKSYVLYNIVSSDTQIYLINNIQMNKPIKNIDIRYNIKMNDTKFIITPQYINNYTALISIYRSDCDWGWNENLYLHVLVNNKLHYYYVGKSSTNNLCIMINTDEKLELVNLDYTQNIPKKIFQTQENKNMNIEMKNTINSIIEKNPEYIYNFFDSDMRYEYIKQHFDEDVLNAYDNLNLGAFKADLFRYCVLYKEGGVYIDCKMILNTPLRNIINEHDSHILVNDKFQQNNAIYNAFICSIPNNNLFKICIDMIVNNVKKLYYPNNPFLVTGPALLRNAYDANNNYAIGNTETRFLNHYYIGLDHTNHNNGVFDENNKLIINKCYKRYYKNDKGGSYIESYKNCELYKNNVFDLIHSSTKNDKKLDTEHYKEYINYIVNYIVLNKISSITDLGCGDITIFNEIMIRLEQLKYNCIYNGVDVVKDIINMNKETFPQHNFYNKNIINEELPKADLCIVSDVLQYVTNKDVIEIINNIKKHNYKHILICENVINSSVWKNKKLFNVDKPTNIKTRLDYNSYGLFIDVEPFNVEGNELLLLNINNTNKMIRVFEIIPPSNNILETQHNYENVNVNHKNIVLITSKIYISTNRFSYTNNRSIYSKEDRFNQTIETIESVKKHIPDAFIVLFDNSIFNQSEYNILNNMCNIFINITNDKTLNYYTNEYMYKAFAEMYQQIMFYDNFLSKIDFSNVNNFFKISGRYMINDMFNYELFNNNKNIFKKKEEVMHKKYYFTSFYKLSKNILVEYFNNLKELFNNKEKYENNYSDFEVIVPNSIIDKITLIDHLGITQKIATSNIVDSI